MPTLIRFLVVLLLLAAPLREERFAEAYATPFARPSAAEVSGALVTPAR